jgi:lambda repressor-like predicted transcriptional regulator
MRKHRGEIIKQAIEDSGIKLTKVVKDTGIKKSTLFSLFHQVNPKLEYIIKIGKAIKHDFGQEIPELKGPDPLAADENLTYKIKYMELLEKYLMAMEEVAEYKKKRIQKDKIAA